ncbi:MAG: Flp pilus assembly complex ATPase component TadA [Deltaproteobacteria bacterium]|nr:Flp pilus assembly complex ATPase component TadA [Deltaproteobacteria bacterium]
MGFVVTITPTKEGTPTPKSPQTFLKDEITIGRLDGNDLVLIDPQVSGKHARLLVKGENGRKSVYVVDVGSSNGTFLEDVRLPANLEMAVQPHARLVVGSFVLTTTVIDADGTAAIPRPKIDAPSKPVAAEASPGKVANPQYEDEIRFKRTIHDQLIQRLDLRRKDILSLTDTDLRDRAHMVVENIITDLRWEIPVGLTKELLIKQILDEALALGPLEELLADEDCSEIMVNRFDQIYAERKGRLTLTDYRFSSEQAVLAAIERILAPIGRRIDESSPLVDARLKDGSRVNAVIRPLALQGPCITIRKFRKDPLRIDDLIRYGALSKGMSLFLKLAVEQRMNIVISGGTGSGKTTLLNVISGFIPSEQRVITVEDAAELKLPQEHVVSFETRPPNLEGKGSIAIRDLVRNALRMRPDRVIVGECRGPEALDMLQAMNTGHDGSMTTAHANTPADMIRRLETMVLMGGLDLPLKAIREQIGSAVQIVLQQTRFACGTRKVTAISEVVGIDPDEGNMILQDVFLFRQDGYDENGKIHGTHQATGYVPKFFRKLQERGLPVDASIFSPN